MLRSCKLKISTIYRIFLFLTLLFFFSPFKPVLSATTNLPSPFDNFTNFINRVNYFENNGYNDTYKHNLWVNGCSYAWNEAYIIESYLYLYEMTKDTKWLSILTEHTDSALSQRDSVVRRTDYKGRFAPAWQEICFINSSGQKLPSKYVWTGFTGAMFWPMIEFARLVAQTADLKNQTAYDGKTYWQKAQEYTQAADQAFSFHHYDWRGEGNMGYYIFSSDTTVPSDTTKVLPNQIIPHNMNSLAALAKLHLGKYYALTGNMTKSNLYLGEASKYARFLYSKLNPIYDQNQYYYTWKYSEYYDRADDVGHSNFVVIFAYYAYKDNIVFNDIAMERFANTFSKILTNDYEVPHNLIDGTDSSGGVSTALYYWHFMSKFKKDPTIRNELLLRSANRYLKYPRYQSLLDTVNIAYQVKNNLVSLIIPTPSPTLIPIPPTTTPIPPSPTPVLIPGDISGPSGVSDGRVDMYDYNLLITDFGRSGSPADINRNGTVDIFDYNILVGNFGR